MFPIRRLRVLVLAGLTSAALLAGCSNDGDRKPKIKKKQGTAKSVDVENRVVSMVTTDKKGKEIEVKGTFRDDTVVVINGRTQTIKDIKPGDKVQVYGYREGDDLNMKWIATRVEVDRPTESDWKTTGRGGVATLQPTARS